MNDVKNNVEIESMVVLVTPELASKWLEKNIDNRNLRKNTINQYVIVSIFERYFVLCFTYSFFNYILIVSLAL